MLKRRYFYKCVLGLAFVFVFLVNFCSLAQATARFNSTLGNGGSSRTITTDGNTYLIQQSIGQGSVIGAAQTPAHALLQGFIQPHGMIANSRPSSSLHATVYPNPFSAQVTIVLGEPITDNVLVTVSDILGKIVFRQSFNTMKFIFYSGIWASGQYIVRIYANQKQHTAKLIKE